MSSTDDFDEAALEQVFGGTFQVPPLKTSTVRTPYGACLDAHATAEPSVIRATCGLPGAPPPRPAPETNGAPDIKPELR